MAHSWEGRRSGRRRRGSAPPDPEDRQRLTAELVGHLARRERTSKEAAAYLTRRGYRAELIDEALRRAVVEGWIDDRRFADLLVRERRRWRPMSRWALLRELESKGVPSAAAEAALASCDPPWDDQAMAQAALAGRCHRWPAAERWRKAAAFLQRRGFGTDVIRAALVSVPLCEDGEGRGVGES